uniref:Uncharacterized protein n=1 Tax=Ananas comosus var. bracteatus TaxID=296719 RepID=A0A6V7NPG0_ANACO|nr:unnamed protein product [Ananas comosus var. bracteatus]
MMSDDPVSRHRAFISSSVSAPTFPTFASPSSSSSSSVAAAAAASAAADRRSSTSSPRPLLRPSASSDAAAAAPSSSSSSSSRLLSAPSFAYNARVALALGPAAAFLLDLGGAPVFVLVSVGLAVAYFLDSLRLNSAAFFAVWSTLVFSQLAFFFSAGAASFPLPLAALALLLCAETTFLIGVWASLQFRYIHIENPSIAIALERLLFACVPVAAPPLFTWAIVSALGMANAAYCFAAFACVFYWLFSIPARPPSTPGPSPTPRGPDPIPASSAPSSAASTPSTFSSSPSSSTSPPTTPPFSPPPPPSATSSSSSSAPSCSSSTPRRGALWWVTRDAQQMHRIRVVNGAVAMVVVVVCLEIRVVFHSFGRYLHAPPPLNYLLVTVTMLGGASALGAYAVGMVGMPLVLRPSPHCPFLSVPLGP